MKSRIYCLIAAFLVVMTLCIACGDEEDDSSKNPYSTVVLHNNNSDDSFSAVKEKGIEYDFDFTKCLNFTALEDGCEIGFSEKNDATLNVEYSFSPNKPSSWKSIQIGMTIPFDESEIIYFRGINPNVKKIEIIYKGKMKKEGDFNLLF